MIGTTETHNDYQDKCWMAMYNKRLLLRELVFLLFKLVMASSLPSSSSVLLHDGYQPGSAKAITCSLQGTWSQLTTSFQRRRLNTFCGPSYPPISTCMSQRCRWLAGVTVTDSGERVSHRSLPVVTLLCSWLWHHRDLNLQPPDDRVLHHSEATLIFKWIFQLNHFISWLTYADFSMF